MRPRATGVALTVALTVALLPALALAQAPERGLDHACPDGVPAAGFVDIEDNVHAAAIECLALYGITVGASSGVFGAGGSVRRDQMASFIVRLLDIAGEALPAEGEPAFTDVPADNVHATAIGQLAALGVVRGFPDGTYRPAQRVRRDQMAGFLNRAFAQVAGEPLLSRQRFFTDTAGNVHEDDINALAASRIVLGPGDGTYLPGGLVRRDQMASFVMRMVDVLAEEELLFTSVFVVTLDGYLVVDGADAGSLRMAQGDPDALGYAFLGLHRETGRLCYEVAVTADGPFATSTVRRAAMDSTGPAVVEMTPPDDETGLAAGCVLADTALLREIEEDPTSFTVDVRSQDYPGGVVRGQIGTRHRAVTLAGAFVLDARAESLQFGQGQPGATGVAVMQIDARAGRVCAYVATDAPGPYLGAHLNAGAMDANGPGVLNLPVPDDGTGEAGGCVNADPARLADLAADSEQFYVSVRTQRHPGGAVRSQLATGMLGIPLSGSAVVDADGEAGRGHPGATGMAWLQADFTSGYTCYWLTTDAPGPFTGSHIVRAPAGTNGPEVVTLADPDPQTRQVSDCVTINPNLLAETAYVERFALVIRSQSYPGGAVRGAFSDGLLF